MLIFLKTGRPYGTKLALWELTVYRKRYNLVIKAPSGLPAGKGRATCNFL
jgi:hypothetical protein